MKESTSDTEPFGPPLIGALLRIPWETIQNHMLTQLHKHGFDDFDAAYLPVFRYPGPQGARPTDLAAQLGISKQALNYLLRQLERLGYLTSEPLPDNLRSKRILLTQRGTAAILVIRQAVAEIETTWSKQLGQRRFDQLRDLLLQLNQIAQATRDHPRPDDIHR